MRRKNSEQNRPDPQERDQETLDRELDELTAEIRVVIPGVTVLLAFLLGLPFTSVFSDLVQLQADVYFTAFLSTAVAVIFLLSGSAYHQIRGKPYSKGLLIKTAIRHMVAALILLSISLSAVVFLVTDLLFGTITSILVTSGVVILVVWLWFALPLYRRIRNDRRRSCAVWWLNPGRVCSHVLAAPQPIPRQTKSGRPRRRPLFVLSG